MWRLAARFHRDSEQSRAKRVQEGDLFTPGSTFMFYLLCLTCVRTTGCSSLVEAVFFADPYAHNEGHQNGPSINFQIEESVDKMSRWAHVYVLFGVTAPWRILRKSKQAI